MDTYSHGQRLLLHCFLMLGALIMSYPLLWLLSASLKEQAVIFSDPGLIPAAPTVENYVRGWSALGVTFTRFFQNSLVMCSIVAIGTVISSSLTAFAFARINFRFRKVMFALMLLTIMMPGFVTVIPEYILFQYLGWVNTFLPITVPKFFATAGFFIFLNVQFIRGIPRELDEAAVLDGANKWQIYWYIILPSTKPALITTAIFSFVWAWDDFFAQLIYLNDIKLYTVPLALQSFMDSMGESSFGPLFAMSVLSLIPAFLFFIFAQRYVVEGIATTGFKG